MNTTCVRIDPDDPSTLPEGRIDPARVDATTEAEIAAQEREDDGEAMQDIGAAHRRAARDDPQLGTGETLPHRGSTRAVARMLDKNSRPDFDVEKLYSWTKDQIIEWYMDGQYCSFIYDPPIGEPDLEERRRVVLIRPSGREERGQKASRMVTLWQFHAGNELRAAYKRLKDKGHRNPRNRAALLTEMMRNAGVEWLDIFTDEIDRRIPSG